MLLSMEEPNQTGFRRHLSAVASSNALAIQAYARRHLPCHGENWLGENGKALLDEEFLVRRTLFCWRKTRTTSQKAPKKAVWRRLEFGPPMLTEYISKKLQIAILRKDGNVKEVIKAYRQTREALLARCEALCERRGNCDRRIAVLEAEIEEVDEVLRILAKYDEDETVEPQSA